MLFRSLIRPVPLVNRTLLLRLPAHKRQQASRAPQRQDHSPFPSRHRISIKASQHSSSVHPNLRWSALRHRRGNLPLPIVVLDAVSVLSSSRAVALVVVSLGRRSSARDVRRIDRVDFVRSRIIGSVPVKDELLVGKLGNLFVPRVSAED